MTTAPAPATARTNTILWATVGVLGVAAMSYFYVAPQLDAWRVAQAKSQAKSADITLIQDQIAHVTTTASQLQQNQAGLDRLNIAVPDGAAFDQLLVSLEAIAEQAGVALKSIEPSPQETQQLATATLSIEGSFGGVKTFMTLIEQNARPLTVSNVSITSSAEAEGSALVNVTFTLSAAQVPVVGTVEEGV